MKAKTAKPKDVLARVTMRLPQTLWDAVQHRAVDEHVQLQDLVARALKAYLKGGHE